MTSVQCVDRRTYNVNSLPCDYVQYDHTAAVLGSWSAARQSERASEPIVWGFEGYTHAHTHRQLRSAMTTEYYIPRTRTKFGYRAFSVAGPLEWNALPADIRNITDLSSFKRAIKTHSRLYCDRRVWTMFGGCKMHHVNGFTYLLIYSCAHTRAHTLARTHKHMGMRTYTHVCAHTRTNTQTHTGVCMFTRVRTRVTCAHTHTLQRSKTFYFHLCLLFYYVAQWQLVHD